MKKYERISVKYVVNGTPMTDTWAEGKLGFFIDNQGRLNITDGTNAISVYEQGVWKQMQEGDPEPRESE